MLLLTDQSRQAAAGTAAQHGRTDWRWWTCCAYCRVSMDICRARRACSRASSADVRRDGAGGPGR